MQPIDLSGLPLALSAVGVIVWLVRLEGRVNTNEALQKSVLQELQYIRRRIDSYINNDHDDER